MQPGPKDPSGVGTLSPGCVCGPGGFMHPQDLDSANAAIPPGPGVSYWHGAPLQLGTLLADGTSS